MIEGNLSGALSVLLTCSDKFKIAVHGQIWKVK